MPKSQFLMSANGISEASLHNLTLAVTYATNEVRCGRKCMHMADCEAFYFPIHSSSCTLLSGPINVEMNGEYAVYIAQNMSFPNEPCFPEIGLEDSGFPFDLAPTNEHPITNIRMFHYAGSLRGHLGKLVGLEITYGDEIQSVGDVDGMYYDGFPTEIVECSFSSGEIINTVRYGVRNDKTVQNISMVTNVKTCGFVGNSDTQLTGYNLLHITGRAGSWFDQLIFVFESC